MIRYDSITSNRAGVLQLARGLVMVLGRTGAAGVAILVGLLKGIALGGSRVSALAVRFLIYSSNHALSRDSVPLSLYSVSA